MRAVRASKRPRPAQFMPTPASPSTRQPTHPPRPLGACQPRHGDPGSLNEGGAPRCRPKAVAEHVERDERLSLLHAAELQ
eukprot:7825307-Alexandrium_andersonii.AAC.1